MSTKRFIWDHQLLENAIKIGPNENSYVTLYIKDTLLAAACRKLTQSNAECHNYLLLGSVALESASNCLKIMLNTIEPEGCIIPHAQNIVIVPCQIRKNQHMSFPHEWYLHGIKTLHEAYSSLESISLSNFVETRIICFNKRYQCQVEVELLVPGTEFRVIPVSPIPLKTAVFSRGFGPESQFGFLYLDETSNDISLVLEDDDRLNDLPLVGIWINGISSVHHPLLWASALRYVFCSCKRRLCIPPQPFLIAMFGDSISYSSFYECYADHTKPAFHLLTGTGTVCGTQMTTGMVFPNKVTIIEMKKVQINKALDEAISQFSITIKAPSVITTTPSFSEVEILFDDVPPTLPDQYLPQAINIQSVVPDASLVSAATDDHSSLYVSSDAFENSNRIQSSKVKAISASDIPVYNITNPLVSKVMLPVECTKGFSHSSPMNPLYSPISNGLLPRYPLNKVSMESPSITAASNIDSVSNSPSVTDKIKPITSERLVPVVSTANTISKTTKLSNENTPTCKVDYMATSRRVPINLRTVDISKILTSYEEQIGSHSATTSNTLEHQDDDLKLLGDEIQHILNIQERYHNSKCHVLSCSRCGKSEMHVEEQQNEVRNKFETIKKCSVATMTSLIETVQTNRQCICCPKCCEQCGMTQTSNKKDDVTHINLNDEPDFTLALNDISVTTICNHSSVLASTIHVDIPDYEDSITGTLVYGGGSVNRQTDSPALGESASMVAQQARNYHQTFPKMVHDSRFEKKVPLQENILPFPGAQKYDFDCADKVDSSSKSPIRMQHDCHPLPHIVYESHLLTPAKTNTTLMLNALSEKYLANNKSLVPPSVSRTNSRLPPVYHTEQKYMRKGSHPSDMTLYSLKENDLSIMTKDYLERHKLVLKQS